MIGLNSDDKQNIAAYITRENPPHLGLILELAALADKYDKVYIVYCGGDGLVSTDDFAQMVLGVFGKFTDKYEVLKADTDFTKIQVLPEYLRKRGVDYIVTSSNTIYINCALHGIKAVRMKKAPCYYNMFQQTAYGKGMIMDNLKRKFKSW